MIDIDENYVIDADQYGYTIAQKHVVEKGKMKGQTILQNHRYYSSLKNAYTGLLERKAREIIADVTNGSINDLKRLTEELEAISKKYMEAITQLIENGGRNEKSDTSGEGEEAADPDGRVDRQ